MTVIFTPGHFYTCVCGLHAQSCPTLCDPMECSLPGPSVHRIFQARIPERVAIPPPGDLPGPGIEPPSIAFPALQADSSPLCHLGSPFISINGFQWCYYLFPVTGPRQEKSMEREHLRHDQDRRCSWEKHPSPKGKCPLFLVRQTENCIERRLNLLLLQWLESRVLPGIRNSLWEFWRRD